MVSGALAAQTRVAQLPRSKWKAVNDAAREHFRTNNIRGMAVAVGVNGQLVYSNGFGIAGSGCVAVPSSWRHWARRSRRYR
jgi:CubicO group peptidase (beta-lactamase class C family)